MCLGSQAGLAVTQSLDEKIPACGLMLFRDRFEILHIILSLNLSFVMMLMGRCSSMWVSGEAPGCSPRVDGCGPEAARGWAWSSWPRSHRGASGRFSVPEGVARTEPGPRCWRQEQQEQRWQRQLQQSQHMSEGTR